jgi:hypothetical protein
MSKTEYPFNILRTPNLGPVLVGAYIVLSTSILWGYLWLSGRYENFRFNTAFAKDALPPSLGLGVFSSFFSNCLFFASMAKTDTGPLRLRVGFCIYWNLLTAGFLIWTIHGGQQWAMSLGAFSPTLGWGVFVLGYVSYWRILAAREMLHKLSNEYQDWKKANAQE